MKTENLRTLVLAAKWPFVAIESIISLAKANGCYKRAHFFFVLTCRELPVSKNCIYPRVNVSHRIKCERLDSVLSALHLYCKRTQLIAEWRLQSMKIVSYPFRMLF